MLLQWGVSRLLPKYWHRPPFPPVRGIFSGYIACCRLPLVSYSHFLYLDHVFYLLEAGGSSPCDGLPVSQHVLHNRYST